MNTRTPRTFEHARGLTARNLLLSLAVAGAVAVLGGGGFLYYRANSVTQLASRARLALEQHDPARATEYLQRALQRQPHGETGAGLNTLMARSLIDQGREEDARKYLEAALREKPGDNAAQDELARSYVNPTLRKFREALKPISATTANELSGIIHAGIAQLRTLPRSGRNYVAEAQLHRFEYMILEDQARQAGAALDAARIARDEAAAGSARERAASVQAPTEQARRAAADALREALRLEPENTDAASLLAQYELKDEHFSEVLKLYEQVRENRALTDEVAISAAWALSSDAAREADATRRRSAAQKLLQGYLEKHPHSVRAMTSLGDLYLDEGKIVEAAALATRGNAEAPGDLSAQVLLINCRLREKKTDEALRILTPLTTSYGNLPEIWYLLGTARTDAGDVKGARDAFQKALAVNPSYTPARRALLAHESRAGNVEAAAQLAAQVLREDRYDMGAWQVTVDALRKRGQGDRARELIASLAADPRRPAGTTADLVRLLTVVEMPGEAEKLLKTLPADDQGTWALRGLVAAAAGNSGEARALLGKAVAATPDDVSLRLKYAELLGQAGLLADARGQLDLLAARKDLTAEQLIRVGRAYLAARLPGQAASVVGTILARQPDHAEALSVKRMADGMLTGTGGAVDLRQAPLSDLSRAAQEALAKQDYATALSTARAGLARDASNRGLHEQAARALAGLKQPDEAVEEIIAAARSQVDAVEPFITFVELFPTPEAAMKGLGYGSRLVGVNPALGAWAMGKLAELSGQGSGELALRYYQEGLAALASRTDPRPAKDVLYQSVLALHAARKDAAALQRTVDLLVATDSAYAPGIRLLAAERLWEINEREASLAQLQQIVDKLTPASPTRLVLAVASRYLVMGQRDRARQLLEKQLAASPGNPEVIDACATVAAQAGATDRALELRTKLAALDAGNPQYRMALAQAQAATGDVPAALRTLDETAALGATGERMARAARLQLLINMGLLDEATRELAARQKQGSDDFASLLAVAEAWQQLGRPEEARQVASAIPPYAAESIAARLLLARLEMDGGNAGAAVKSLQSLLDQAGGAEPVAIQLFLAHLRAGDAKAALSLAQVRRSRVPANTPAWRSWTTYAATAAREGSDFAQGIRMLESLDPESRRTAAPEIALMKILQGAAPDLAGLPDEAPAFTRSTLALLAGLEGTQAGALREGRPSAVLAQCAGMKPEERSSALTALRSNNRLFGGDIQALASALAGAPAQTWREIALVQQLLERGWTTTALDRIAHLAPDVARVPYLLVMKHQALTDLRRTKEAEEVRQTLAKLPADGWLPSVRVLLAASLAQEQHYEEALAMLQPLAAAGRPEILTTQATLEEKLGRLDRAIALHRQVRKMDPENIPAANNLAYTLAAAHPGDKAALAEARQAIDFAVARAPDVTAFQDTLGWIQIQSGQAAEGTHRIARVLPSLRLDPAVHYHAGVGYARLGQNDLARLHLQNVEKLGRGAGHVPEIPLASEALRSLAAAR